MAEERQGFTSAVRRSPEALLALKRIRESYPDLPWMVYEQVSPFGRVTCVAELDDRVEFVGDSNISRIVAGHAGSRSAGRMTLPQPRFYMGEAMPVLMGCDVSWDLVIPEALARAATLVLDAIGGQAEVDP